MPNTTQIIAAAIARSKSRNEIVTIDGSDSLCSALFAECEGDAVRTSAGGCVHEYWGADVDGNEWRVHVRTAR